MQGRCLENSQHVLPPWRLSEEKSLELPGAGAPFVVLPCPRTQQMIRQVEEDTFLLCALSSQLGPLSQHRQRSVYMYLGYVLRHVGACIREGGRNTGAWCFYAGVEEGCKAVERWGTLKVGQVQ